MILGWIGFLYIYENIFHYEQGKLDLIVYFYMSVKLS